MTNIFEILNLHLQKIGGRDNLKTRESVYIEGALELKGSGLSGTYREWKKLSSDSFFNKIDIDLRVIRDMTVYTGNSIWQQDNHGKVTNITRDELLREFQVKGLMEKYEFVDPDSEYFKINMKDEDGYYIFTILNSINEDIIEYHINKSTFLLDKKIDMKREETDISVFSDYRLVKELMVPFEITTEIPEAEQIQHFKISSYNFDHLPDSVFYPPKEDAKDFEFLNDSKSENIPFEFLEGHIYLNIRVNEKEGKFILDSGASKSLLDNPFCESLGLEKAGNIKGKGVGKESADFSFAVCKSIMIDNIILHNQTLVTADLSHALKRATGIQIDGLLGFDFLSRFITKIDFAKQFISFYDPEEFKYTGEGSIVKAELVGNLFRIPLTIDNQHTGYWSVDTGAKSISFNYPFTLENNLNGRTGLLSISGGIGGEFKTKSSRFNEVEIGGFKIKNPLIGFPVESLEKSTFSAKSIMGNLGTNLLRHFIVYLDYKDNQIILEPGENFNKVFPENLSGLQLEQNGSNEVIARFISPDSPAERAGLLQDDVILEINNKPVSEFKNLVDIRACFRQPPTDDIVLTLLRNKQTRLIVNVKL